MEEKNHIPTLRVQYKYAWGRHLYFPLNTMAKKMLKKYNRKNFTLEQIKNLQEVGVIVEVVSPDMIEGVAE